MQGSWSLCFWIWGSGSCHPLKLEIYNGAKQNPSRLWVASSAVQSHTLTPQRESYHTLVSSSRWFFGKISRSESLHLVLADRNPTGAFLIRISEKKGAEYVLSGKGTRFAFCPCSVVQCQPFGFSLCTWDFTLSPLLCVGETLPS